MSNPDTQDLVVRLGALEHADIAVELGALPPIGELSPCPCVRCSLYCSRWPPRSR